MTASDRFERLFADMLGDVAQPAYPDYIDDVLDRATRRSQRPAWTFPERWFPMSTVARPVPFAPGLPWRSLAILAVLALLAAAAVAIAIGQQARPAPPFGPARNGTIVYQVDGDLYARPLLGGGERALVSGPDVDVYPLFARDGTKLAFFRLDPATLGTANELATLMVANADGSGLRALGGPVLIEYASWSPNSRELALVAPTIAGQQLSIVPIDGSAPRVIDLGMPIAGSVDWRPPDGRELIFRSPAGGPNRFYAIGADGTGLRQITPDGTFLPAGGDTSLTPDGRWLLYMNMAWPYSIHRVDLESGQEQPFGERLPVLSDGDTHAGGQQVSADGTKLIFGRYWDERDDDTINHQVWVASITGDGSDAVPVGQVVRAQGGANPFIVTTAPDGTRIVVHRLDSTETWATDLSGGGLQPLDLGNFFEIDWQRAAP